MKYLFLLLFTITSIPSIGQELIQNSDTGYYESQGVIELNELNKDEIFTGALEWIALKYNSANDVIQLKDKEAGKIIVKGNFSSSLFGKQGFLKHTLRLEFKDNRFRYTYTDFSYYSSGSGDMPFEGTMFSKKKIISTTQSQVENSIKDMTNFIKNQGKDSDW